jgi:hypothetical protein
MGVKPCHQRLAELFLLYKRRTLTAEEVMEMQHCLAANAKYCWEMAYLENMSLLASMTNDMNWQHEICADIDALEYGSKTKRPAPKTDQEKKDRN